MKRVKSIGELVVFVDASGTQKTNLAIVAGYEKDEAKPPTEQLYYKLNVDTGVITGNTVQYHQEVAPQSFVYSLAEYEAFTSKYKRSDEDGSSFLSM